MVFRAIKRGWIPSVSSCSNARNFFQPVGLGADLFMSNLLEARPELRAVREFDCARDLIIGQSFTAERHHAPLEDVGRLGRAELEARGYDLSHHRLRLAEHRD